MKTMICGWYTPDYAHYHDKLVASLRAVGVAEDQMHFIAADKTNKDWAYNTGRRPEMILKAMKLFPEVRLLWLDVDCTVQHNPLPFVQGSITADFAAAFDAKPKGLMARGGTLVIAPSARSMIMMWKNLCERNPHLNDEQTLPMALAASYGLTSEALCRTFSTADHLADRNSVIVHDMANHNTRRGRLPIPRPFKWLRKASRPFRTRLGLRQEVIL